VNRLFRPRPILPRHKDGDLLRIVRAFKFTDMRQTISVVWSIALICRDRFRAVITWWQNNRAFKSDWSSDLIAMLE
jgi:hypothetical protein